MKKQGTSARKCAVFIAAIAVALLMFAVIGCSSAPKDSAQETKGAPQASAVIQLQDAIDIAMQQVGITESDVTYSGGNLENYNGTEAYKVILVTNETRYVLFVATDDGRILKLESEVNLENPEITASAGYISLDEAKNIATSQANKTVSEVVFTKEKLDEDDGIVVYEIDFVVQGIEYECKINAKTGDLLEFEKD